MAKAIFAGKTIAESDNTVIVEGNHYFPRESIKDEYFVDSDLKTVCPWKGEASYFSVIVDGKKSEDAAWYYPRAKPDAKNIENYVAFWRDVKIEG